MQEPLYVNNKLNNAITAMLYGKPDQRLNWLSDGKDSCWMKPISQENGQ